MAEFVPVAAMFSLFVVITLLILLTGGVLPQGSPALALCQATQCGNVEAVELIPDSDLVFNVRGLGAYATALGACVWPIRLDLEAVTERSKSRCEAY